MERNWEGPGPAAFAQTLLNFPNVDTDPDRGFPRSVVLSCANRRVLSAKRNWIAHLEATCFKKACK